MVAVTTTTTRCSCFCLFNFCNKSDAVKRPALTKSRVLQGIFSPIYLMFPDAGLNRGIPDYLLLDSKQKPNEPFDYLIALLFTT